MMAACAWLMQVFTNILVNAVKFTPEGGCIRIACSISGEFAVVQIRDTGIGIAASMIDQIFDPFRRGSSGSVGAGLGLAIARELVERLGGRVSAKSEGEGKGTTFDIELPISPAVGLSPSTSAAPPRSGAKSSDRDQAA